MYITYSTLKTMAGDNGVLILKDVFFSQGFVYHKSVINPNVSPVPILIVLLQFCLCFLSIRVFICVFSVPCLVSLSDVLALPIFKQEKTSLPPENETKNPPFQYVLCAATSPAVKLHDETLTYLNQGETSVPTLKRNN